MKRLLLWIPAVVGILGCESIVGVTERTYRAETGGQDGGGQDSGNPPPATPCGQYCEAVMANCLSPNRIYDSPAQCLAVCTKAEWDPGDANDGLQVDGGTVQQANSLQCRLNQAKIAEGRIEVESFCANASPLGGTDCVDDREDGACANYCDLIVRICPDSLYDPDLCQNDCQALVDQKDYSLPRDNTGDTLQCRAVHLSRAAGDEDEDSAYCSPAQVPPLALRIDPQDPTFPCRSVDPEDPQADPPRCEDYCRVIRAVCVDEQAVYESQEQCEEACGVMDPGTRLDYPVPSPDTVGCRMAHAYNVMTNMDRVGGAATHCPHAGPGGGGACPADAPPGTGCLGYCTQLEAHCPDQFRETFDDANACREACSTEFSVIDPPMPDPADLITYNVQSAEEDEGLGCRLLHAIRAGTASDAEAEELCASALGGAPCAP